MSLADVVALVLLVALVAYTVTGGADFGGGVWELFASGPRRDAQRTLIERALAPIWEANHVWLILIVVVLFVALPVAFAAIMTALHIPLVLLLIGIVLRGAAFVFRTYDPVQGVASRRWRSTFAVASLLSPVFLGVCFGALVGGDLRVDSVTGRVLVGFTEAWLAPFPMLVGAFVLALVSWLAAIYLAVEAQPDALLADDFRLRALIAGLAAGALGIALVVMRPDLASAVAFQVAGHAAALAALGATWTRRFRLARALAVVQVALIVTGLGVAHAPFIVAPDLTFARALAPTSVVEAMLLALAVGAPILGAALFWLYRVFKRGAPKKSETGRTENL